MAKISCSADFYFKINFFYITQFSKGFYLFNLGPFLRTIFLKLENMLQNSLHVNLLLTGIISRLAHYSQPLLRSLLLNHSLVLETNVKSLFQVNQQYLNKTSI